MGAVATLCPLPTAITHFATKLCQFLIPMGMVATLYPLPTSHNTLCDGCVPTSYRWYGGYSLSVTDSHHTLRQKLCRYLAIPMGIVATLYPVTDSHLTHFGTAVSSSCRFYSLSVTDRYSCQYLPYRWCCPVYPLPTTNTLRQKLSVPHTDGYSGYSLSVTDVHNTLCDSVVSYRWVPHYPVTDSRALFSSSYRGYGGSLSVTDSRNALCDQKLSVPHTDGYSGYSLSRYRQP
ncbi:unnamed protein product [Acanthosepion pharaonis]|uniref:Uncharacterized protein n=1 Tax=Acanthosepion pharaonis TaxID=158019 RepID=A0A812CSK3_ACAPH|nr:unnamed protein product [Sepia pharaonis]